MKHTLIITTAAAILTYIFIAFVSWNWDIASWKSADRGAVVFMALLVAVLSPVIRVMIRDLKD
jgi:hypothetical protein